MAQLITQARPYARAAFDYAKQHNDISAWLVLLQTAAAFMTHSEVANYIMNPKVSSDAAVDFLKDVLTTVTLSQENFFKVLATDTQLNLLPDVAALFTLMSEQDDEVVAVEVSAAIELSQEQQQQLQKALETRLQKNVKIHCSVDAELLGGAVIRTPEWVMDGSVHGKLQQLKTKLVG